MAEMPEAVITVREKRLSLFTIEAELLQLIDQREDVLERMADSQHPDSSGIENYGPVLQEELAVVESLIRQYLHGHLVAKTDSIGFAVKEYEARAEARKAEAERMKASADRDAETAKRIKAMVLEVMQEFGEKKLPGRLFTITRQGNGGMQALTIAQPDLVPEQYIGVNVTLRLDEWRILSEQCRPTILGQPLTQPYPRLIREVLERAEAERKAINERFSTMLESASEAAKISLDFQLKKELAALPGVPGCRLEPRGESIRIK